MHTAMKPGHKAVVRMACAALAAALVAALAGCQALIYLPLLILAPIMPILQFAIKVAARYGPMLLMLMAEADQPASPTGSPVMLAAEPASALTLPALPDLEMQITNKLATTRGLRSISIVEANRLTPAWLEEQCRLARAQGCQIRMVFVDSRRFAAGDVLQPGTRAALAAAGVRLQAGEGIARRVAGDGAELICLDPPKNLPDAGTAAVMASLAGTVSLNPEPRPAPESGSPTLSGLRADCLTLSGLGAGCLTLNPEP